MDRWCRLVNTDTSWCPPADLRLGDGGHDGPVVVHPGAASSSRRWPAERWRTVIRELRQDVVVTGTPAEADLCEAVAAGTPAKNLCGHLSLPELARTVADARLLICGDTGVAHLGTSFRTSSLLLFGPVSPRLWGPAIDEDRHVVLWHGDEHAKGDPHGDDIDPALAAITTREVTEAAARLLSR